MSNNDMSLPALVARLEALLKWHANFHEAEKEQPIGAVGRKVLDAFHSDVPQLLAELKRLQEELKARDELDEQSWQELAANIKAQSAELSLTADNARQHPGIKALVAILEALLDIGGEKPPNYQSFEFMVKPQGSFDEYKLSAYVIKPGGKTPHKLRMEAESERDTLRSANERMRAEQSELLNAAKPFVNMCTAYEDHTKQFKWSDPIISESIVGSIKFGGNELKHIKMGNLRAIRDAYNSALEGDLRRAAEAVGDEP